MSLNPCCSGQWSRTERRFPYLCRGPVLILVVVDNGLVLHEEGQGGAPVLAS